VLLVDAIAQAPHYGWGASRMIGLLGAAAALLVAFIVIERRVDDPLVPLSIFGQRTLAGANVAGTVKSVRTRLGQLTAKYLLTRLV
jgi:hypothetical protein